MITPNSLAFPFLTHEELRDGPTTVTDLNNPGLTKRELFAIKALTVVAPAAIDFDYSDRDGCYYVAKQACQMADALLAALDQQPEATLPEHKEVK